MIGAGAKVLGNIEIGRECPHGGGFRRAACGARQWGRGRGAGKGWCASMRQARRRAAMEEVLASLAYDSFDWTI